MTDTNIYKDIAVRAKGDIYMGVVGPVRTGKSTFIKKFMETLVIPNIQDEYGKERTTDSLPQSAGGKTVMTTEPKFIPDEAVAIQLDGNIDLRVKMVDCVGYVVPGALGLIEDGVPRMVMTPWSESEMPFEKAAEMGTKKVICEHSTIGFLVTTDGSIGELERESYVDAESRVVAELKEQNKPFVIVLNSAHPESESTVSLALSMEEAYGVPVALVNCLNLDSADTENILSLVLSQFPINEIEFDIPSWIRALDKEHELVHKLYSSLCECSKNIFKISDIKDGFSSLCGAIPEIAAEVCSVDLACGNAKVKVSASDKLFYSVLGEETGFVIDGKAELIEIMSDLSRAKREYDKIADAIAQVNETGYGIVSPSMDDLTLEEPEIVRQAGGYGVKLRASAPSIHMIRANIETEVSPMVGSEKQSEDMVKFLLKEFEEDPKKIWESNMFGKSLHELVNEGLNSKLAHMPYESRMKLSETLQRIINEGSGGLICIIL